MAKFLSEPTNNTTPGERSFFTRIEHFFRDNDEVLGYNEPDIRDFHPDFLLLSPKFGIIIVEVKDYSPSYLKTICKTGKWDYLKDDKIEQISNPFDQIHQYWRAVKDRINHSNFPEKIDIPIIRIVAFSQISKEGEIAKEIKQWVPNKIYVCFKEIVSRNTEFQGFLNDILPVNFSLSNDFFNLLHANIIPTCRLPTLKQSDLMTYFTPEDQIKLLDKEQEKFACTLGEGHRLVFGVAGSGKTIILISRARILALRHPNWKILVLCFNRLLKTQLFRLLNPQDYDADITISTFHSWARNYILSASNKFSQIYQEAERKAEREDKLTALFQTVVPQLLLQMLKDPGTRKNSYDAILIDEAQDFEQDWFRALIQVLDPKSDSLLITCDGVQGIYARKKFYWSDVGIQARGRVKKFAKSYRMPIEIGALAQKVIPQNIQDLLDKFDEFISIKEFAGTPGTVEISIATNRDEEYKQLTEKISRIMKQTQEVLVLFKYNIAKTNGNHLLIKHLKDSNIEWKDIKELNQKSNGLLVGTIHSTKGLECDTIIIPEVDKYLSQEDRQLLYVGMTRARKKLILSASKPTDLITALKKHHTFEAMRKTGQK